MTAAHHAPGGGFRNPWPGAEPHGFTDFLKWRLGGGSRPPVAAAPPQEWAPRAVPQVVRPRAAADHRAVTWIGHATVLLQLGGLNVLTDPVWSERASPVRWVGPRRLMAPGLAFDALPDIDVVLLSHNHYDHLDAPTVRRIIARHPGAVWLCPLRVGARLRRWGVRRVEERDWWETVDAPGFRATCTPAQHFSSRSLWDRDKTLWCGWTLAAGATRVFFAGDTGLHPEFAAVAAAEGPFDLVILPIGAYEPRWFMGTVHMNPEDAVAAYAALCDGGAGAPPCVSIHWGTFRLTDEPVEEPPARFARCWREARLPEATNWTLAFGETRQF